VRTRVCPAASRVGVLVEQLPLALVTLALIACSALSSSYFAQPSSFSESDPATAGTVVYAGVASLDIQPGDSIRFVRLENVDPAVTDVLIGRLADTDAALGMARESEMTASDLASLHDLEGAQYSSSDGPVQIALKILTPEHDVNVVSPMLVFEINGGPDQREPLLAAVRVCSTASDVTECDAPSPT